MKIVIYYACNFYKYKFSRYLKLDEQLDAIFKTSSKFLIIFFMFVSIHDFLFRDACHHP